MAFTMTGLEDGQDIPLGIRTAVVFRWHEGDEIVWRRAQQNDLIPGS